MDAQLQAGINATIKKLDRIDPFVRKYIKQDLGEASNIITSAIKGRTPVGTRRHGRFKPGNLKKSIRKLPLRKPQC